MTHDEKPRDTLWAISTICLSISAAATLTLIGWGIFVGIFGNPLVARPGVFGGTLASLAVLTLIISACTNLNRFF